ncbi:MAG: 16S rRNA (adenine(1518)-N(6)/adenine(1519)-N(6))-dimethyltransferase RsmA [Bacteroidota bacterium]|nr:16S rRNA (adenine(1518)-N(6)/adenine(1519)-N(6))-dimethyltransferase RsmA [Bacteroidota bacterium]
MIRAKKSLGQHFLNDMNIAKKIVDLLSVKENSNVLEVGPGTGVLTQFLLENKEINFKQIEIDKVSVDFLLKKYPELQNDLIEASFLKTDIQSIFKAPFSLIGNFPYNISSQILFKVLENRDHVPEVVCMLQKEVAERIASPHGSKRYGILSVLMQTFYNVEYCFTVNENVFIPPPRVKSAVIKFTRISNKKLNCDEKFLFRIVKQGFNQRRKTLRNSLKSILVNLPTHQEVFNKRPEQLSISEFESLVILIEEMISNETGK